MDITNYCESPTVSEICTIYGPCWGKMDAFTRVAIVAALSYWLVVLVVPEDYSKNSLAEDVADYGVRDSVLYLLLDKLGGELKDISQVSSLVVGILQLGSFQPFRAPILVGQGFTED